jgi:hypothetical protein
MMNQVVLITVDQNLILPDDPAIREYYRGNQFYYHAMAFLASTIRDLESDVSIYRGEDVSDTVEEWFSEYRDMNTVHFYERYKDEMIRKATHMHHLLPPGVYERLDFHEATYRAVYFTGVVHAVDYR